MDDTACTPHGNSLPVRPLRFFVLSFLSFVLLVHLPTDVFVPLNQATARLSGLCLAFLGMHAQVSGDMVSLDGFRVRIITECTALYSFILFGAFVSSTPATMRSRLAGLLLGATFLTVANAIRIALVTTTGAAHPALFEIVHIYLAQVVMLILVIGAALVWLRWAARTNGAGASFLLRAALLASAFFPFWLAANDAYIRLTDRLLVVLFALANYSLQLPSYEIRFYFQTFNVVLYCGLILAERRLTLRQRLVRATAGSAILAFGHLLFRFGNVLLTACAWQPALPLTIFLNIFGEYLLPVLFWLMAVRTLLGKKEHINETASHTDRRSVSAGGT